MSVEVTHAGLRRTSEQVGVAGWLVAAVAMYLLQPASGLPFGSVAPFIVISLLCCGWNALSVALVWRRGLGLVTGGNWEVPLSRAVTVSRERPDSQWLGRGFDWTPLHSQRFSGLLGGRSVVPMPPAWLRKLCRAREASRDTLQSPRIRLIDAVEPGPAPVFVPLPALASHTLIFGQTGTGKTRLAELLVTSFLARHPEAVVFMIDPKGDRDLRNSLERACCATGRPKAFLSLHPAFPGQSIRFDPLRNFTRTTSIATRIASLLPAAGAGDAFTQFAWGALHRVAEAMVYAGQRPTLLALRRYLEEDARPLLALALEAWGDRRPASVVRTSPAASRSVERPAGRGGRAVVFEPRLAAAIARYHERVLASPAEREPAIDGLLSLVKHDPTHFSKMIQNLMPLLAALTAGDLGALLSPDAATRDPRPIFDARKIIDQRRCLYIGLDSLTDATVGAAIGAITLADLAQVAGDLFNHRQGPAVPVLVFVDEAAEVVNAPLVQLLNKSRGAGFTLWLAAQTVHDYEARLGSAAAARMLLGNPGNLIALRTTDAQTQRFCAESLVQTEIEAVGESRAIGLRSTDGGSELAGAIGARRERREAALFAPEWLGLLPDLHYFARIAGGRSVKGELPRLVEPQRGTRPSRAR